MKRYRGASGVVCALVLACSTAYAVDTTIGVNPSDGVNMFVKAFSVSAGTTITGAQFTNNDAETVFPTVVLVRGGTSSLSEGTTVRTTANASETSAGIVTVTWSTPVVVSEAGTYYVGINPPNGSGKQGAGDGPGIGATKVSSPAGSFIATGENGELLATGVDLGITLLTTGGGPGKAGAGGMPSVARTFLGGMSPNPSNPSTTIEFGVAQPTNVSLTIYDVGGRPVRELVRERMVAGTYERLWNGRDDAGNGVAAGVYIVRFIAGDQLLQKKIALVK